MMSLLWTQCESQGEQLIISRLAYAQKKYVILENLICSERILRETKCWAIVRKIAE